MFDLTLVKNVRMMRCGRWLCRVGGQPGLYEALSQTKQKQHEDWLLPAQLVLPKHFGSLIGGGEAKTRKGAPRNLASGNWSQFRLEG